jgi:primase-polymerase (primpol)-like protein
MSIPDDLTELDQWVLWRRERATKVPYQVNGHPASSTNPRTWAPFETADRAWRECAVEWSGIGFVFSRDDSFVGIDLDHCLTVDRLVKPWASGIVRQFADTYMEVSPSGRGLKIWARGELPKNLGKVPTGDGGVEMYSHSRYFTVTGDAFNGAPLQVEEHGSDIRGLYDYLTTTANRHRWTVHSIDGKIPYGTQHDTLIRLAGLLRARQVCEEAILACLLVVNRRQCERPGPDENIERMVRSTRPWGEP